jgi:hypothetical protein
MGNSQDVNREAVRTLASYAPLRGESQYTPDDVERVQVALQRITPPITLVEAMALLPLLDRENEDDLFGLIWTLVALLETAPGWPPPELASLPELKRPWFKILLRRAGNS